MIEYEIKYSRRKTVGIYILRDGSVEIRSPKFVSSREIETFIRAKEQWIQSKVKDQKNALLAKEKFRLGPDSKLLLLGRQCPVVISEKNAFENGCFYVTEDKMKAEIVNLYKSLAKQFISERVAYYADVMNTAPTSVRINSANTRWGSCSADNRLNFTWKLIMAPPEAVDYVVVHELAHTVEHNHSPRFWNIVRSHMPDYQRQKKALRELQSRLGTEEWDTW